MRSYSSPLNGGEEVKRNLFGGGGGSSNNSATNSIANNSGVSNMSVASSNVTMRMEAMDVSSDFDNGGEQDTNYSNSTPNNSGRFKPIHFGHLHIHENKIIMAIFQAFYCLSTIVYNINVIT